MHDLLERYGEPDISLEANEDGGENKPLYPPIVSEGVTLLTKMNTETGVYDQHLWIDLFMPFDHSAKHMMMDRLLSGAPPSQMIVRIHSNGGSIDEGVRFMNVMETNYAGRTKTIVDSKAYSMGAMIFCKGDKRVVHPHSSFMLHNYATLVMGKGGEIEDRVDHMGKMGEKQFSEILEKGWIDSTEYQRMLDGKDLWMDADEMMRRGIASHVAVNGGEIPAEDYLQLKQESVSNSLFQQSIVDYFHRALTQRINEE